MALIAFGFAKADVGATRSIRHSALSAAIRSVAAYSSDPSRAPSVDGPLRTFACVVRRIAAFPK
jgi:hypothetical protein